MDLEDFFIGVIGASSGGGGGWPAALAARFFFFLPANCLGAFFSSGSDFLGLSLLAFLSAAPVSFTPSSASLLDADAKREGGFEGSRMECMRIMFIRKACFRMLMRSPRLCCTIIKFIFGEDMVRDKLGLPFMGTRRGGGTAGLMTGEALILAVELSLLSSTGRSLRVWDGLRLRAAFIIESFSELRFPVVAVLLLDPGVGSGLSGAFMTPEDAEVVAWQFTTTSSVEGKEGVTCFMEAWQYLE